MSLKLCGLVYVIHYLLQKEIHQEESITIPLATRGSNSALVSPSTPRNTGGTEHEMENDGRDNDSVSPDHDTNDKKKTSDATFPRLPIESNVW